VTVRRNNARDADWAVSPLALFVDLSVAFLRRRRDVAYP